MAFPDPAIMRAAAVARPEGSQTLREAARAMLLSKAAARLGTIIREHFARSSMPSVCASHADLFASPYWEDECVLLKLLEAEHPREESLAHVPYGSAHWLLVSPAQLLAHLERALHETSPEYRIEFKRTNKDGCRCVLPPTHAPCPHGCADMFHVSW